MIAYDRAEIRDNAITASGDDHTGGSSASPASGLSRMIIPGAIDVKSGDGTTRVRLSLSASSLDGILPQNKAVWLTNSPIYKVPEGRHDLL